MKNWEERMGNPEVLRGWLRDTYKSSEKESNEKETHWEFSPTKRLESRVTMSKEHDTWKEPVISKYLSV